MIFKVLQYIDFDTSLDAEEYNYVFVEDYQKRSDIISNSILKDMVKDLRQECAITDSKCKTKHFKRPKNSNFKDKHNKAKQ